MEGTFCWGMEIKVNINEHKAWSEQEKRGVQMRWIREWIQCNWLCLGTWVGRGYEVELGSFYSLSRNRVHS